jgi:hypothetical protein
MQAAQTVNIGGPESAAVTIIRDGHENKDA